MSNSVGCIFTTSASCLAASDLVAEVLEVANNVNNLSSRLDVTVVATPGEKWAVEAEAMTTGDTCKVRPMNRDPAVDRVMSAILKIEHYFTFCRATILAGVMYTSPYSSLGINQWKKE